VITAILAKLNFSLLLSGSLKGGRQSVNQHDQYPGSKFQFLRLMGVQNNSGLQDRRSKR
jgi:hypothetical protein